MSLCYPWTTPWWHFQVPLILVCISPNWHCGGTPLGESCRKHTTGILVSGQVWGSAAGLQELSWQTSALPANENSAGIDSSHLLPWFVLVPDFGSRGLGGELWDGAVLPCSCVCGRGRLSWGSASSGKRWRREGKPGSVSNQSLLMLELPNSVFTHQGLMLMVIYSHFLVNN